MRPLWLLAAAALAASCSSSPTPDAGADAGAMDSGQPPPSCANGADCVAKGWAVCRDGACAVDVACADDVECGLGERCESGSCLFEGCVKDADCPTGKCRADVFQCVECGASKDCPSTLPVCDLASNTCVQCSGDSDCSAPGPGYCDTASGACVHCLADEQCPNGLKCNSQHLCYGAPLGNFCGASITCDVGLTCVTIGGAAQCLKACSLYQPDCNAGDVCFKLTFTDTNSLVFDTFGPLGVCYAKPTGYKDYRQACTRSGAMSNCLPNLVCVPDDANVSLCRTFCDPNDANACPVGEKCHTFPGDYTGRLYGLCYPDNGWGDVCTGDAQCRAGEVCGPYDDPSAVDSLSPVCQFDVGDAGALAPCGPVSLADGGTLPADTACASGACVGDSFSAPSLKYYCYAACAADSDCSVGGRQGYCDGTYSFPTSTGTTGSLKGCRVRCGSDADCADYAQGGTCRARLVLGYGSTLTETCAPPAGTGPAGAACSTNADCASGLCVTLDARGVGRRGYCGQPCAGAAECGNDAGVASVTGLLDCQPTDLLGWAGFDGVAGTGDDLLVGANLCTGAACVTDTDCGGAVCVPDVDAADAGRSFKLHCLPPSIGVLTAGQACTSDAQCLSGVCGTLQAPSTGSGRACFEACDGTTACPGATVCRAQAMRVDTLFTTLNLDSCAP